MEVVTQTQVTLSSSSCNVQCVAEILRKQLGVEVILLDCKCYPLMNTECASSESFQKSSRKVLAANKALFQKIDRRRESQYGGHT